MLDDLEFDAEMIPGIKLGLHTFQIIFSFVCWCLEIVVFRSEGSVVNGQNGWMFGVCFLSIPAWIYLIGAPRFPRTRKLAEPHAMVAVDCIFTILWLSAFAAQAAFNTANLCGTACSPSKAIVGLGFFVFLSFAVTSFLSIYTLRFFQLNGRLPGYDKFQSKNTNIDPDKAAFSMAPHDEEAYAPVNMNDQDHDHDRHDRHDRHDHQDPDDPYSSAYGGPSGSSRHDNAGYDGGYGSSNQDPYGSSSQDPYASSNQDPYGRISPRPENPFDDHAEYHPPTGAGAGSGVGAGAGAGRIYAPPTAHDDYEEDHRPVQFPAGNYDRGV